MLGRKLPQAQLELENSESEPCQIFLQQMHDDSEASSGSGAVCQPGQKAGETQQEQRKRLSVIASIFLERT